MSDPFGDSRSVSYQWRNLTDGDTARPAGPSPSERGPSPGGFNELYRPDQSDPSGFTELIQLPSKRRKDTVPDEPRTVPPEPDIQEIEKQAYAQGFAKGEKDGLASGMKQAEQIAGQLQSVLSEINGMWETLVRSHEKQILRLICLAVEKVVYTAAAMDHEGVRKAILNAFEVMPEAEDVTICVSPEDYDYIETVKGDIFRNVESLRHVSVVSDPSIKRGGCSIDTRSGRIDTGIDQRLGLITECIMQAYNSKQIAKAQ